MGAATIRVMCVDDHRIVRDGIALIIGRQPDMEVVGAASTGEASVEMFQRLRPDVTLMDLQLGSMSGVEAIREIRRLDPTGRIILLTMFHGDEDIYRALEAGATTCLLKDTLSDELVRVVREVHAGRHLVRPDVTARPAARAAGRSLTPREVQVMELVAQGMRNEEVGAALGMSEETAHVHLRNIFIKLGVNDRSTAVTAALRRGIIHLSG